MATYYVEPKSYPAYAATPANTTTSYDGDGLAKGLATPAVCTIDLNGVTANGTTDTITLCGVQWTPAAASGATLATNLAAQIIGGSAPGTSTVNAADTNWVQPQMRNALYAAASGTTLTIQTRAGSAVYNNNTSWKAVGTGGLSSINHTFSGGVSGAWGYLWNDIVDGTVWPQNLTRGQYGLWGSTLRGLAGPLASGNNNPEHVFKVRCNGKAYYDTSDNANTSVSEGRAGVGIWLFDDGTEWPTDAGWLDIGSRSGTFYTNAYQWGTSSGRMALVNVDATHSKGLRLRSVTSRSGINTQVTSSCEVVFDRIVFQDDSNGCYFPTSNSNNFHLTIRNCRWNVNRNAAYTTFRVVPFNYNNVQLDLHNNIFDWSQFTGAAQTLINVADIGASSTHTIFASGNKLLASSSSHLLIGGAAPAGVIVAENNSGFAINNALGLLAAWAPSSGPPEILAFVAQQGMLSPEQFRFENRAKVIEWDPTAGFPTYNAYLPDGTAWSIAWYWSSNTNVSRWSGIEIVRRAAFVTEASKNTVTLELLFDNTMTPSQNEMGLVVQYTRASDSKIYTEASVPSEAEKITMTSAIPTSAASWTKSGSYSSWTARKLTLVLAGNIKQNTQIDVALWQYKQSPLAGTTKVFINPEPAVSTT